MCRVASSLQDVAVVACWLAGSSLAHSKASSEPASYVTQADDITAMSWVFFVSWFIDPTAVAG